MVTAHWTHALRDVWGLTANLTRLDGEYDLNFKVGEDPGFILKVMHAGCAESLVDLQCKAMAHLRANAPQVPVPDIRPSAKGPFAQVIDEDGTPRLLWLQTRLNGIPFANYQPRSCAIVRQLGHHVGAMDDAFARFSHAALDRDFKWNLTQAEWIANHLDVVDDPSRRALLDNILGRFSELKPRLMDLPFQAIHNDINDYNILVTGGLAEDPRIAGLIDFGDMCAAPRVCELAIAGAYCVLGQEDPETLLAALVEGYHAANPLTSAEVDLIWPLLEMRLAVSVVNSTLMALETPDDPYVVISQKPAWDLLESDRVNPATIGPRLRLACGFPITDAAPRIRDWLASERGHFAPLIGRPLDDVPMGSLSVEESTTPRNPFQITACEAATAGMAFHEEAPIWMGYYAEPRLIYTEDFFRLGPWKASDRRTVHIAVDVFADAETPLFAPLAGTVEYASYRDTNLDYGGVIILRHETPDGDAFFSLYGHLSKASVDVLETGQRIEKGQQFARLGVPAENGRWSPHVHFQLSLILDGFGDGLPGVATPDLLHLWEEICPNPAALLNLPNEKTRYRPTDKTDVQAGRKTSFGSNLKLSYDTPAMLVRGWRHHLFDEWGRPYLDAYNNVPHVGHAHPRIQSVAADQLKRMNSNTRYLHPAQVAFADKIVSKMPDGLSVCYFVNSGSEANELSLRLARSVTGGRDMITPDHGYHGNTTGAIDISAYKFNAPGGVGQPDWVHLVEVADDYRGSFGRNDPARGQKYAAQINDAIEGIKARGGVLAGFIAETFPSVGGQIIPPKDYLKRVYKHIRAAGGVCIADEVQTGLGRLGTHYYGFEQQDAVPDIVVLGKPIGNGHPIGVVVTTTAIASAFAEGPEFFSTFGGSTLSCRIGKEVLDIVDDEELMQNARTIGDRLLEGLRGLQQDFAIMGDVRGMGLFLGVELVSDPDRRTPGTEIANYVVNRMRDARILLGREGPYDNILKIRPPLTFDEEACDMLLWHLRAVLEEVSLRLDVD